MIVTAASELGPTNLPTPVKIVILVVAGVIFIGMLAYVLISGPDNESRQDKNL